MSVPTFFYTPVHRGLLKLTGKDRQSFLQGMVSNDTLRLQPGEGCYAFMLDATAHVLTDMHVLNVGDYLLLDLEEGMAPFVAETLEKYLIMEKCRITDVTSELATVVVGGSKAVGNLREWTQINASGWKEGSNAPFELAAADAERILGLPERFNCVIAMTPPLSVPALTLYVQPAQVAGLVGFLKEDQAEELSPETLDALRIEAGIPRFGKDVEKSVLAPETGQRTRGISYRKGCYIGQEIVARIDARGHTNRGFVEFLLDTAAPVLPPYNTPVFVEGKEVGRITSAAISPTLGVPIGLGYLRNEHATPGTAVMVGAPDGIAATVKGS